jgi:PAS domain
VATKDGRWLMVRIMPYRTLDDRIDGLVITFADITAAKSKETKLGDQHASLQKRFAEQTERVAKSRRRPRTPAAPRQRVKNRALNRPGAEKT